LQFSAYWHYFVTRRRAVFSPDWPLAASSWQAAMQRAATLTVPIRLSVNPMATRKGEQSGVEESYNYPFVVVSANRSSLILVCNLNQRVIHTPWILHSSAVHRYI
jgi:hypothetical protein